MTECGLCGATMTGAECEVCGWRAPAATIQTLPSGTQSTSAPAPRTVPAPHAASPLAPVPQVSGVASTGSRSRTAWVLGGLLAAVVAVGVVAVGTSGGGRPAAPATAAVPGGANTGDRAPGLDGSAPGEDADSVPDTPAIDGGWITVLESVAQKEGGLGRARAMADELHRQYGVDLYVIDSGHYKGLNPGWWAVVMVGFDSNQAARVACSSVGRSPSGSCYGRKVKG